MLRGQVSMDSPNEHPPATNVPHRSSEEPSGFSYGAYSAVSYHSHSAVRGETQAFTPSLQQTDQRDASVSYAVGGSVSSVSLDDTQIGNRRVGTPRRRRGGGIRGKVRGFSRVSRRNLLRRLASINRTAFRAFEGKVYFLTLTYPKHFPDDPEPCKRHLKAFLKRLERGYGPFAAFWRLGIQQRGAWHFHLLLFVPHSFATLPELHDSVASCWYEVTGKVSEGHLRVRTNVEVVRKWKQATSFAEKYLAKEERFPEGVETGRVWGRWNKELLPVQWETTRVSLSDAYRIRRVYRKLARIRSTGSLHRLTVFVRYENVISLLGFLGYQLE
jgi:hypothetical protein